MTRTLARRRQTRWSLLFAVALAVVAVVAAAAMGRLSPWIDPALRALSPTTPTLDAGGPVAPEAGAPQHKQASPLSSAQLGAPLVKGSFVTACNAPSTMKVVAKVTVQKGHAIATDVNTDPPDTAVTRCIDDAIGQLRWDISPTAQQLTVHY